MTGNEPLTLAPYQTPWIKMGESIILCQGLSHKQGNKRDRLNEHLG